MAIFTVMNMCTGNYYFEVHRQGCPDIAKKHINGKYDVAAESVDALIEHEIADMSVGSGGDLEFSPRDFKVYPCARVAR